MTLFEVSDAAKIIGEAVDPEANIIFGVNINPNMGNEVKLTLIATGFASRDQISGAARDKEITKMLKNLKSEEDLSSTGLYEIQRQLQTLITVNLGP